MEDLHDMMVEVENRRYDQENSDDFYDDDGLEDLGRSEYSGSVETEDFDFQDLETTW